MIDLRTALKAKIPFISIHTDDPVNVKDILQSIAEKILQPLPIGKAASVIETNLYWTEKVEEVTADAYRRLVNVGASCVVINPDKPSMLVFETGVLQTPPSFFVAYLKPFTEAAAIPLLVQVLKGLSLKAGQEVIQLTMARVGSVSPQEVRKTRQMLSGEHPGLSTLDTDFDFYEWPKELKSWLDLNDKYFLDPTTPEKLVPRGLLLAGEPGVGKSMASMVLAKHFDVPLLRLDVSSSLTRWLGESESRIASSLSIIEASAPCVWLLDESEKLFGTNGEEGTSQRILSQMLWWLQYHKARVLTIMTTNDLEKLPKELYRAERVDKVIHIEKLSLSQSKLFAAKVYEAVLKKPLPLKRQKWLRDALDGADKGAFAHAQVRVLVYEAIKSQGWLTEDK